MSIRISASGSSDADGETETLMARIAQTTERRGNAEVAGVNPASGSFRVHEWEDVGVYDPPPRVRKLAIHFLPTCPRCHRSKSPHQDTTNIGTGWLTYYRDRYKHSGPYPCHCNRCKIQWWQPMSYMICYSIDRGEGVQPGWINNSMVLKALAATKRSE